MNPGDCISGIQTRNVPIGVNALSHRAIFHKQPSLVASSKQVSSVDKEIFTVCYDVAFSDICKI